MRWSQWGLFGALLLTALASGPAAAADDPAARRQAAARYVDTVAYEQMVSSTVNSIAATLPHDKRNEFVRFMSSSLDWTRMRDLMVAAMASTFSVGEIDAMTDFYGSEIGKSIMQKFGPYMAKVMPAIQGEVLRVVQDYKRKLERTRPPGGPERGG